MVTKYLSTDLVCAGLPDHRYLALLTTSLLVQTYLSYFQFTEAHAASTSKA